MVLVGCLFCAKLSASSLAVSCQKFNPSHLFPWNHWFVVFVISAALLTYCSRVFDPWSPRNDAQHILLLLHETSYTYTCLHTGNPNSYSVWLRHCPVKDYTTRISYINKYTLLVHYKQVIPVWSGIHECIPRDKKPCIFVSVRTSSNFHKF